MTEPHRIDERATHPKALYVGIDVHKKKWVVTIRAEGLELKTFAMNPSPKELAGHLKKQYPGWTYSSVYEAGFCGFWIHRQLLGFGVNNRVVHAADVPTTNKEKVHKRDPRDSRKLARELEKGELRAIYVPKVEDQELRSLCRLRYRSSQQGTRLKNRIKSHLHYFGIYLSEAAVSRHWSAAYIRHLQGLCAEVTASSTCLRILLDELHEQRRRQCEIVGALRTFASNSKYGETIRHLMSIPGIGFITAVILVTEIIDIDRFQNLDHLAAFVGLVPATRSSGDSEQVLGLSPRKNIFLKYILIEAAWIAVRKDPALLAAFNKLCTRMHRADAIVRIARKLLNRIRYVWKHQTAYVPSVAA